MKKTIFALSAALLAGTAIAATPGYYVYGGLGYVHTDADFDMADANDAAYFDQFNHDKDDKDLGVKLAAGYRFNDHLAVEGSYTYLGKAETNYRASIDLTVNHSEYAQADASMKGHMFAVDALAIYPVTEEFELFAKGGFGIARVKTEGNYSDSSGDTFSFSNSKTRFLPKLGLGAEWKVTEQFAIRAEYERLFGVSKDSEWTVDADYNFFNVGVKYTF